MLQDRFCIFRLAIGRETHDFIFARVDLEARVIGESRVEQPERMGEMNFLDNVQRFALPYPRRGRRPFSNAVHGQDERRLKQRRIIGRSGVGKMMFAKAQFGLIAERRIYSHKFAEQKIALK